MKNIVLLICLFGTLQVCAKEFRLDFNQATSLVSSDRLVQGVTGKALDLSDAAYNRYGIEIESIDSIDFSRSFSVFLWVKSSAKDLGYKALVTNKKALDAKGFLIGTQENGSWMVSFCDGEHEAWDYKPTVERQPINDGQWHQIGLTHHADKQEMRMYYDGRNVAIYCTNGNENLATSHVLHLGCIDSSQWHSFNGQIDDFFFVDHVLTDSEIKSDYHALMQTTCAEELPAFISDIKVMAFNIYHGGHELGEEVGVNRVVEVIKESGADVIGMIETYGSGAIIADALGYYFYLRSSNLSIMSKYPINETYDLYDSFNCSGANLQISRTQTINYINLWLDYRPITNEQLLNNESIESIIAGEWSLRAKQLKTILANMYFLLDQKEVPLVVSGDFNSDSHLDWGEDTKHLNGHKGYVIEWPTSKLMYAAGFKDSYRTLHPNVIKYPCLTWSTMAKNELQYRIDFIYYKGKTLEAVDSEMIDKHRIRFPSDHAALVTSFKIK